MCNIWPAVEAIATVAAAIGTVGTLVILVRQSWNSKRELLEQEFLKIAGRVAGTDTFVEIGKDFKKRGLTNKQRMTDLTLRSILNIRNGSVSEAVGMAQNNVDKVFK